MKSQPLECYTHILQQWRKKKTPGIWGGNPISSRRYRGWRYTNNIHLSELLWILLPEGKCLVQLSHYKDAESTIHQIQEKELVPASAYPMQSPSRHHPHPHSQPFYGGGWRMNTIWLVWRTKRTDRSSILEYSISIWRARLFGPSCLVSQHWATCPAPVVFAHSHIFISHTRKQNTTQNPLCFLKSSGNFRYYIKHKWEDLCYNCKNTEII